MLEFKNGPCKVINRIAFARSGEKKRPPNTGTKYTLQYDLAWVASHPVHAGINPL